MLIIILNSADKIYINENEAFKPSKPIILGTPIDGQLKNTEPSSQHIHRT